MSPFKNDLNLIVSHQDQVAGLPEAAQVLAGNEFCPNYMLQKGTHMLTIQSHPEFSTEYSRALMNARKHIIPASRIEETVASLDAKVDDATTARWIANFFKTASA